MDCIPSPAKQQHRQKDPGIRGHEISPNRISFDTALPMPALVTTLLDRNETRGHPTAEAAIKAEGRAFADAGTWLESSVIEKHELGSKTKHSRHRIQMGEI